MNPAFKGTILGDFRPLVFFSSFEPAWATDQWVKILSILVKFSLSYSNFCIEKTDCPLPSAHMQFHTAGSKEKIPRTF